jgi:uncharacterized protein YtpQ (UPF0354 family)
MNVTSDGKTPEASPRDSSLVLPLIKRAEPPSGDPVSLPDPPVMEHLVGDLFVAYVLDLPDMFQYVNESGCGDLGVQVEELRSLAVHNLTRRRPKPEIRQIPGGVGFVLDGDLEASLLLVPWLWDQLDPQIPGDLIAAVPTRDVLMVTGSDVDGGTDALAGGVERVWRAADRRLLLTRDLLTRRDGTWHV